MILISMANDLKLLLNNFPTLLYVMARALLTSLTQQLRQLCELKGLETKSAFKGSDRPLFQACFTAQLTDNT